jgi:hypothetical protein
VLLLVLASAEAARARPGRIARDRVLVTPEHLVLPINPSLYVYGDLDDVVLMRGHELVPFTATPIATGVTRIDVVADAGPLLVATFRGVLDQPRRTLYHVTDRATSHEVRLHGFEWFDEEVSDGRLSGHLLQLASDATMWRITWSDGTFETYSSRNEHRHEVHEHAVEPVLAARRNGSLDFTLSALFDDGAEVFVLRVEDGEIVRSDARDERPADHHGVLAVLFALGLLLCRRQARAIA